MRVYLGLLAAPLLASALACSLLSSDDAKQKATTVPTAQVISQARTAIPTAQPTQASQPTATTAATLAATPSCSVRADWPTITVAAGETLASIARRVGSTVDELSRANCLSNPNAIQAGQTLRVPVAIPPATVIVTNTPFGSTTGGSTGGTGFCSTIWFFTFKTGVSDARCPAAAVTSKAAGQDFEGGRVFWYEAAGNYPQSLLYVVYNDGTWEVFPDTWNTSLPYDDPSIVPPAGRYAPVAGIGKLWRENPNLRAKLGWAYETEKPFTGRRQEPAQQNPNSFEVYIDYGKQGLVLLLRSTTLSSPPTSWIVAGGY